MRVVVTGQVGLDKKAFLQHLVQFVRDRNQDVTVFNVGDMMYAEAPAVAPGKILDMSLSGLRSLRRSVFKDILSACSEETFGRNKHIIINTHATFRWKHGLFYAFDYDQMKDLSADLYITMVDNVDRLHYRLVRDGHVDHSLKDLMVWREEEILATELLSQTVRGHGHFYVCARGADSGAADTMAKLICQAELKKAYLSFPMSHVNDSPDLMGEIEDFRRQMKRYFICFDPGDLEEKHLGAMALKAAEEGHRTVRFGPPDQQAIMETSQLIDIIPDIDGQIYARDFMLIDQSDMIVSLIPSLCNGRPEISSGVERELQHAHEATRDVFVIWTASADPSPFITETATKVFDSVAQAVDFFTENGYIHTPPAGSLFENQH